MDRWNELIAGYVLNNLTEDEEQELSAVLADNPQLMSEISRLRGTATLKSSQRISLAAERLPMGSEGWADMAVLPTDEALSVGEAMQPQYARMSELRRPQALSSQALSANENSVFPDRGWLAALTPAKALATLRARAFARMGWWSWLVLAALVVVGIDNWRMRRLLAIAQERILQVESTTEYLPSNVSDQ
ncbi:MAG: hypothetical protein AAGM27_11665 [Cyanobacteria bacterium J06554_3]